MWLIPRVESDAFVLETEPFYVWVNDPCLALVDYQVVDIWFFEFYRGYHWSC